MTIARTFIRGSTLALGLTLAATGALAGGNHTAAGSVGAVCQACQPHNDVRPDQHRRAKAEHRPGMVRAVAQPPRMAPVPQPVQPHQQIPGIVILLGSL
jgi:hypothetical protein